MAEFDESKHKRDENGKFTSGGGGSNKGNNTTDTGVIGKYKSGNENIAIEKSFGTTDEQQKNILDKRANQYGAEEVKHYKLHSGENAAQIYFKSKKEMKDGANWLRDDGYVVYTYMNDMVVAYAPKNVDEDDKLSAAEYAKKYSK